MNLLRDAGVYSTTYFTDCPESPVGVLFQPEALNTVIMPKTCPELYLGCGTTLNPKPLRFRIQGCGLRTSRFGFRKARLGVQDFGLKVIEFGV